MRHVLQYNFVQTQVDYGVKLDIEGSDKIN